MTPRRTLIAGFGNVLLGDDGFGVEVIKRLAASDPSPHVEILDVGIAGMHFVLQLIEGFDAVIVVDAVKRGQPPGTLYVFTPSEADLDLHSGERIDPHFAEPVRSLKLARALGLLPEHVIVVGCEPLSCELGMSLSVSTKAAVGSAVATIRDMLLADSHRTAGETHPGTPILP
jgi:hydrogenase maturation protease